MSDLLTYSRDERVASITLDDGKVNALSIPMLRDSCTLVTHGVTSVRRAATL